MEFIEEINTTNLEKLTELKKILDNKYYEVVKSKELDYAVDYNKYRPISIICPTRERCHSLYNFLFSASRTAYAIENFEIIFICDEDDTATPLWIEVCKKKFPKLDISYYIRERSEFLNKDYFNWALQFAKGKYYWVTGDDLIFIKPDWDRYIFDMLDIWYGRDFDNIPKKPDRIVYINIKDDTPVPPGVGYDFSCFPIMSKEAVDATNIFMIPEIPSWCSDYPIALLYHQTRRFLNLEEQIFKHIGVETGTIIGDEVTRRLENIMKKYNASQLARDWVKNELPKYKEKIYNYIKKMR